MCFLFGPPFICLLSDEAVAVHDADDDNEVTYTFSHSLFIHIKVMSYNRTSSTTRQADRPTDGRIAKTNMLLLLLLNIIYL